MNRRAAIKRTAAGLFVPAWFDILRPSKVDAAIPPLIMNDLLEASIPPVASTGNLIIQWKMDENSGTSTTADSSGYNYTGQLQSSPTWNSGLHGGNTNAYLTFNGSSQYIKTSGNVSQIGGVQNASLSAWVNVASNACFGFSSGGSSDIFEITVISSTGNLYSAIYTAGSQGLYSIVWSPYASAWKHIVLTYDGTQSTSAARQILYINGSVVTMGGSSANTPASLGTAANLGKFYAGYDVSNTNYTNGSLDDVRLYNVTLTSGQVTTIYNSGPQ